MSLATHTQPDPTDIAQAYKGLRQSLMGFLRHQVTDPAVAEDLLHEVFLKALHAMQRGDSPTNLTGWLYTIARNSVIDYYRAKRPSDPLPDDLVAAVSDDNLVEQDLARCLRPLTETLPPLYRNTLLATDFDGMTMQFLATQEGVSISAIKSRASRGRKLLRQNVLACCKVDVSSSGEVLDFHANVQTPPCHPSDGCH
nr:sigma-70 family RNA polymerase sigma factor [uncultured Rhodoferax sp.]